MATPARSKRLLFGVAVGCANWMTACERGALAVVPQAVGPAIKEPVSECPCGRTLPALSDPGGNPTLPANAANQDPRGSITSATAASSPSQTPISVTPPKVESARERVTVTQFDCSSADEHKRHQSLRQWASGGPYGAAWNIYDAALVCEIGLESPCAGRSEAWLFGNARQLAKPAWRLVQGKNSASLSIAPSQWTKATIASKLGIDNLLLSIGGIVYCDDIESGNYHFADSFLAGFSGGE